MAIFNSYVKLPEGNEDFGNFRVLFQDDYLILSLVCPEHL
jgi:hypothetical protein